MADPQGGYENFDIDDLAGTPAIEHALFAGDDDVRPALDTTVATADIAPERLPGKLGLPVGRPSRAERKRQQERVARAEAQGDDPFATLLAPLDDDELEQLRADVERDEVLYVRHQRAQRIGERLHRLGTLVAIVIALILAIPTQYYGAGFWQGYIEAVNRQVPPTWLDWAGEWAGGIWMALAIYAAVMWLVLVAMAARGLGHVLVRATVTGVAIVGAELVLLLLALATMADYRAMATLVITTGAVIFAAAVARIGFGPLGRGRGR